jgi:hypothetical protein
VGPRCGYEAQGRGGLSPKGVCVLCWTSLPWVDGSVVRRQPGPARRCVRCVERRVHCGAGGKGVCRESVGLGAHVSLGRMYILVPCSGWERRLTAKGQ